MQDVWTILSAILASSLVSSVVTLVWNHVRERRTDKRDAAYSALRLATLLESFAIACGSVIGDVETFIGSNGAGGERHGRLPELQSFPEDIAWKLIPADASSGILAFSNDVALANGAIDDAWMNSADPDDTLSECSLQCARLGKHALNLAEALRKKHRLPVFRFAVSTWSLVETFDSRLQRHADYLSIASAEHRVFMKNAPPVPSMN